MNIIIKNMNNIKNNVIENVANIWIIKDTKEDTEGFTKWWGHHLPGYNHISNFWFTEIHIWIKKSVKDTWKAWRTKEVDWGPSTSIPNVLNQDTTSLLAQGKKEIKSNMFWGWIRTATLRQLATAATTSFGLHFGRSSTPWNPYEVYLRMDLDSCLYLAWGGRNDQITTERFFLSKVLRRLILAWWALYQVGPIRTCPRVGAWHQDPLVILLGINKD